MDTDEVKGFHDADYKGIDSPKESDNKKKIIFIIIGVALVIVIGILIGLFFIFRSKKKSDTPGKRILEPRPAKYSVKIHVNISDDYLKNEFRRSMEVRILGKKFFAFSPEEVDLYVDGKIQPFSRYYTFKEYGNYTVEYKTNTSVRTLKGMFQDSDYITYVSFANFSTKEVTDMSFMFEYARKLTSVDFGDSFSTEKVVTMESMFEDSDFTSLDLSHFNTKNLRNANRMFDYSTKLESLNLSSFDTPNLENMERMFSNLRKLTSLDLSKFNTSKVTTMENTFYDLENLRELKIPFDTSNLRTMSNMFFDMRRLTSLDLSSFNTSLVTNLYSTFYYCSSLKSLNLSNFDTKKVETVNGLFSSIGRGAVIDISNFDLSNCKDFSYLFTNYDLSTNVTAKSNLYDLIKVHPESNYDHVSWNIIYN